MDADWKDHIPGWLRISDKPVATKAPSPGRGRGHTKLDVEQAMEIAKRFDRGESIRRLAQEYQVARSTMANTVRRVRRG